MAQVSSLSWAVFFGGRMSKAKTKTSPRAPKQSAMREVSVSEMADVLIQVPEIQEAFTRADLELALDDRGWMTTSSQITRELDPQTRRVLITKSRLYWHRDPLAHQAVRLWTDYALANGVTFNCDDKVAQTTLNKFWKDRRNRKLLSSEGQRKSSKKLLVDGEQYFAIFGAQGESKTIRRIDTLQITDRITDPDDEEHVLAYRRALADGRKFLYYADWTCTEEDRALAEQQKGPNNEPVVLQEDVVVYHLPFDSFGEHGNGLLFPAVDWSKEHRRFMEARVAITQSLAKYAHKITVKGGQAVVDAVQKKLQSTYVQSGPTDIERNPPSAPGSSWIGNAGASIEPMPRVTGAGDAKEDGNALKLMVSAATGIMLHYFGDPSTGNLATATAMELPMLKMFESYQQLWLDAYRDIFSIVLEEDPDEEAAVIDIDLEPILKDDLEKLGSALTAVSGLFPEMAVDEVLQACLVALGINNVDEVMKSIEAKREENAAADKANADRMQKLIGTKPGAPGVPGGPGDSGDTNPVANNLSTEAANNLAAALVRVAESLGA
jgi:hypothetical protein